MKLTPAQWEQVAPYFKRQDRRRKKRGRPFKHTEKEALEGILWVLKSGARWRDLPEKYPPYQTCHRWFQFWVKTGALRKALKRLAIDLKKGGGLDLKECFIDATFVPAKKGDSRLVKPNGERVRNSWQLQTALLYLSPSTQALLHPTK